MKKIKDLVTQRVKLADVYPGKAKELGLGKDAEFVRKFFVAKSIEYTEADDALVGVISTATMDRDNEILDPKGADLSDYNKNRTVLWAHSYGELPVGTNMWIKIKKGVGLVAATIFAPRPKEYRGDWFPDTVKHMMQTGHLRAFSVGFVPLEAEEPEQKEGENPLTALRRIYKKWLLLEYSIVPVPSNPDALMAMVKSGEIHDLKMVEDMGINKKQIGINKGEEKVKDKLYLEKSKISKDEQTWTLLLEAGIELVYARGDDGDAVVRGLMFDPERFDEKSAGEWYAGHKYIEEIVGDEAIKGDDGMPTNEALHDLYVRTMVLTQKGTLSDAMKAGKYNCECISCGHTLSSDEHCANIKCPECGGEMRRLERPGPGKDGEDTAKNKGSLGDASGVIPPVEDKDGDDKGPGDGDNDDDGSDNGDEGGEGDDEGKDNTDGEGDDGGNEEEGDNAGGEDSGEGDGDSDNGSGEDDENTPPDGGKGGEGDGDDEGGESREGDGDGTPPAEGESDDEGDGVNDVGGEGGDADKPGESDEDEQPKPDEEGKEDQEEAEGTGEDEQEDATPGGNEDDSSDNKPEFDAEGEEIFEIVTDAGKPVARKDLKNLLSELLSEKLFNGAMEKAFKDTLEGQLIKMLEGAGLVAKEKSKKIVDNKNQSGTLGSSDPEFADETEAMTWLTETDEGQKFMLEIYTKEAGRVT